MKNKVAEERKKLALTQTDLAKELNISRTALWNIENGTMPKAMNMKKIAEYFGKSVDYMFFKDKFVCKNLQTESDKNLIESSFVNGRHNKNLLPMISLILSSVSLIISIIAIVFKF